MRTAADILEQLRPLGDPAGVEGMARYGIRADRALGVRIPVLRAIAKELRSAGRHDPEGLHALAEDLWATGVHEARLLAIFAEVPALVDRAQAERWVAAVDSWDLADQFPSLLVKTPFARDLVREWSLRDEEYVKRTAFSLMVAISHHDKTATGETFREFLSIIEREASDERNFVKKAVNWALRDIGKRDAAHHAAAVEVATRLRESGSVAARWVAADALRELGSPAVRARLGL